MVLTDVAHRRQEVEHTCGSLVFKAIIGDLI
jgi:hypothetical protein